MPGGLKAITRTSVQSFCWCLLVCGACSKKADSGQSTGTAQPSASTQVALAQPNRPGLSCTTHGTSFSLGPVDTERASEGTEEVEGPSEGKADAAGEPAVDLPFGVTIGGVRISEVGYVVSAIDARQGGSHAVLAFLDAEVARGSVLDLGRVYGDAEPPKMVVRSDGIFVVVPDTDASGNRFRYGWVRGFDARSPLQWLGTLEQRADESPVFALADTATAMTVAWDELERKSKRGIVRWGSFEPSGRKVTLAVDHGAKDAVRRKGEGDWLIHSTNAEVDAEAPQLVSYGKGYWLAYLASEPALPKPTTPRNEGRVRKAADDDVRAIELGRRGIEILPLDSTGRENGKPIRVVDRSAHVVTFDIEATPDGGALVAYRDMDTTPGAEAQVIEIARVRPDGGVERLRIDDERVGAGMPMLLLDASGMARQPNVPSAWVSVAGNSGENRLAPVPEGGTTIAQLVDAPQLVGVEPMHWQGDSLLVARHRARYVEFERMTCTWQVANADAGTR